MRKLLLGLTAASIMLVGCSDAVAEEKHYIRVGNEYTASIGYYSCDFSVLYVKRTTLVPLLQTNGKPIECENILAKKIDIKNSGGKVVKRLGMRWGRVK